MAKARKIETTRNFLKQYAGGSWEKRVIEAGVVLFREDANLKGLVEAIVEGKLVYNRPVYEVREAETEEAAALAGRVRKAWLALSGKDGFDLASALRCCREFPDYIAEESMALVAYAGMLDEVTAYLRRKSFYGARIRPVTSGDKTPAFAARIENGEECRPYDDDALFSSFLREDPRYAAFAKEWEASFLAYEKAFLSRHAETIERLRGPLEYAISEGRRQLEERIAEQAAAVARFKEKAGEALDRLCGEEGR